jgi:ethanolamine utilization microcompartment shell protein EutS
MVRAMAGVDLRTFSYIDVLQPQTTGFLQTVAPGYQPLEGQASLYVEVAPGMAINQVTDICLKQTSVTPGFMIVERSYGMLEVHDFDQGQVRNAGQAILDYFGMSQMDRLKPVVLTSEIIVGIEGHQAMLINRMRHGDLICENDTLYIFECHPAAYAAVACNEAEKAANISVLEMTAMGAYGRLYLGGDTANIEEARDACVTALAAITGRENDAVST